MCPHTRTGAKRSEPERDIITLYQDFKKSQRTRRGLCLRNEASRPAAWSEVGSPARDRIEKLPVSEKVDLLQLKEVARVLV